MNLALVFCFWRQRNELCASSNKCNQKIRGKRFDKCEGIGHPMSRIWFGKDLGSLSAGSGVALAVATTMNMA